MESCPSERNEREFEQTSSRDVAISIHSNDKMVKRSNEHSLSDVEPKDMSSSDTVQLNLNCSNNNNNNWQEALQNLKPKFSCNFVKRELTRTQSDSSGFGSFRSDSFINSNTNYDLNDLSRDLFEDGSSDSQTSESRAASPECNTECNIGVDSEHVGEPGVICNVRGGVPKMGCVDSPHAAKRSRITRNIPDRGTWQEHCNRIENNLSWLKAELKIMRSQDEELLFLLTRCQSSISRIKRDKERSIMRARLCCSPEDARHWEEWEINAYERRRQAGGEMSPSPVKQKQPVRSHPMSPAHRVNCHGTAQTHTVNHHVTAQTHTVNHHAMVPPPTITNHDQQSVQTVNSNAQLPAETENSHAQEPAQTQNKCAPPEAQIQLRPKLPPKPTRLLPTRLIYRDDTEIMV